MSTQQGSNRPEGEKPSEGLSKYIKRMRTVLRRSSTAKTSSVSSMQEVTGGESSRDNEPAKPTAEPATAAPPTTTTTTTTTSTPAPTQKRQPAKTAQTAEPTVVSSPWSSLQQEKARTLFAKYGLTLEPGEWKSPSDMTVQRVNKPIRMRVRRTCHRCQTTFGPDKVCVNCQHARCKKCPRHPPPKSQPSQQQQQQQQQPELTMKARLPERKTRTRDPHSAPIVVTRKIRESELTIPSRTGGQDLVRRPARQRVRRNCHECGSLFPTADATECISCGHIRCKKCPRDPPKLHKYPDGYPGDAEPPIEMPQRAWRKPRQRVRYTCHICSILYRAGERSCSGCGQERGPQTLRDPPKKIKPDADPEIVRRVQERLAELDIIA